MIEINDIPDKLVDDVKWKILASKGLKSDIALIIREAIDAGLVSPPCFCVRQNGELRKFDSGEIKVFSGKPWAHDTEHYKGQTS